MSEVTDIAGFEFVQRLASDLNTGKVEIPSFPDIVVRIKQALDDPDCNIRKLARVVGTEPALAARLLLMSNSALMKRGDAVVGDLHTAIGRLGSEAVRTAAMSVAIEQIFIGSSLQNQKHRLRQIWKESAHVAAICFALARELKTINPDEALLAGLLHNIGKLYILMRGSDIDGLFDNDEQLEATMVQWHAQIGRAIIEGWGFSDELAAAVADHADLERAAYGPADLTDLVTVAWLISQPAANDASIESGPVRAFSRIGIDEEMRENVLLKSKDAIDALSAALSG